MIYQYVVSVKNERARYINIISISLSIISAVCFLYQQLTGSGKLLIFLAAFLAITAGLAWNWYKASKQGRTASYSFVLLVAGFTWFAMPVLQLTGILYLILACLEKKARLNLEIKFSKERIVFNTVFEKKFDWSEFNNVLLKDGMLTLDFRNNSLFQKLVVGNEDDTLEANFNAFCREHLEVSSNQGIPDTSLHQKQPPA